MRARRRSATVRDRSECLFSVCVCVCGREAPEGVGSFPSVQTTTFIGTMTMMMMMMIMAPAKRWGVPSSEVVFLSSVCAFCNPIDKDNINSRFLMHTIEAGGLKTVGPCLTSAVFFWMCLMVCVCYRGRYNERRAGAQLNYDAHQNTAPVQKRARITR